MLKLLFFILISILYLITFQNSFKIFFINIKKYLVMLILVLLIISAIVFSKSNYKVAQDAFMLWANNIIPSLLPFFIFIELLKQTPFIKIVGKLLTPIMRPIFNVPGSGAFPIAMGISSGYPTGAKITAELYKSNECSKEEAERLLSFTNTSGPLFIIGAVGIGMFNNQKLGILLLLTHFLGSISVGIIFRYYKRKHPADNIITHNYVKSNQISNNLTLQNLGANVGSAIQKSISTILLIGGYIVLFAVIGNILQESSIIQIFAIPFSYMFNILNIPIKFSNALINGLLEVTNGIKYLANESINYNIFSSEYTILIVLVAFILGFGGLSVIMQTASIISDSNLSIKPYIIGKILHGTLAAIYTYIFLKYTSFINSDYIPAFNYSNSVHINVINQSSNMISCICLLILTGITVNVIRLILKNKKNEKP